MARITRNLMALLIVLLLPGIAAAETKKFRTYSYITDMHFMPIKIAKAPAEVLLERRGIAQFEDGETALFYLQGTVQMTPDKATAQGYSQYTFNDGATSVIKWQVELSKKEGEELLSGTGKGTYVSGTGRLEGIKGEVTYDEKFLTPYSLEKGTRGDLISESIANYTLPAK